MTLYCPFCSRLLVSGDYAEAVRKATIRHAAGLRKGPSRGRKS